MNTEIFYDSLDEASSGENLLDSSNNLDTSSGLEISPIKVKSKELDISLLIPLYGGETVKTQTNFPKTRSNSFLQSSDSRGTENNSSGCVTSLKSDVVKKFSRRSGRTRVLPESATYFSEKQQKSSYLSLFHRRIGYPADDFLKKGQETTRGICGDETMRSATSNDDASAIFEDARDHDSEDSESFYLKLIEEEKNQSGRNYTVCFRSSTTASIPITEIAELKSVSEQCLNSGKNNKKCARKNRKMAKADLKIPRMGGLGPDNEKTKEKLNILRKKQSYGQQMSDRNRIKLNEAKLLKDLKREINKSSLICGTETLCQ